MERGRCRLAAVVASHGEAARLAFSYGCTVLLTVGSSNIGSYVREARRTGLRVFARVLPIPESLAACRKAGLPEGEIVRARGPFSVEENREAMRSAGAGTKVTKDRGAEGGVPAKMEAARVEGCRVVVVGRPPCKAANTLRSIYDCSSPYAGEGGPCWSAMLGMGAWSIRAKDRGGLSA